ncbi:MAG: dihydroorotate dehydrogenase electron transfer subunit [Promethearchaeota archaeon]
MDSIRSRLNKPRAVKILEKIKENSRVCTIKFHYKGLDPEPGQFVMVWIPGIDEIPMSISMIDRMNDIYGISVAAVGDATVALCKKGPGDLIGIRGPFGRGFRIERSNGHAVVVGGGIGIACVNPIINILKNIGQEFMLINAAKTESELTYHEQYLSALDYNENYFVSTDDGSFGYKGRAHELFQHLLKQEILKPATVYGCGPELMLRELFDICEKYGYSMQFSLERMMRCGVGICGLCSMDDKGLLVCKDGPVFTGQELKTIPDFGRFKRGFSGKKIPLK